MKLIHTITKKISLPAKAAGHVSMLIALILYVVSDVICKKLLEDYPAIQVTLFRTIARIIPITFLCISHSDNPFKTSKLGDQIIRALIASLNTIMFMCAYKYSPMTNVHAISYSSPFFIILFSYIILGEKIKRTNIISVLIGFLGIILIIQPNFSGKTLLHTGAIFAILGSISAALNNVLIRKLSQTESLYSIMFFHNFVLLIISISIAAYSWSPIQNYEKLLVFLMVVGTVSTLAQYLISYALSISRSSDLAPTSYAVIIPIIAIDILLWDSIPNLYVIAGMLLIIWCNYIVMRNRRNV